MLRRFRKSGRVTLVLIGASTLFGCGGGDDTRRDVYKSREDCLADWGNKPEDCKPASEPRHAGLGYFYGPSYLYSSGWGARGWTRVRLAAADAATLESALTMAWQNRTPKKLLAGRARPATKAKTSRKSSGDQ